MSDDAFTQTRRILRVLLDEHKAPPMALVALANLRRIEDHHRFLSQRIATLEAQREAVADVASEGDVEDLLDALDNLSADPKDGETWAMRYQTAGALHDAWQDERQRRMQAEEDAERWHRLFDEGATLTAQIAAERDRLAAEVERLTGELARHRKERVAIVSALGGGITDANLVERVLATAQDREEYRAERDALRTKLAEAERSVGAAIIDRDAARQQAAQALALARQQGEDAIRAAQRVAELEQQLAHLTNPPVVTTT